MGDLNHFDHFFLRKNKSFKQPQVKKAVRSVDQSKPPRVNQQNPKPPEQTATTATPPITAEQNWTKEELEAEERRNFVRWVTNGTLADLPKVNHHLNLPGEYNSDRLIWTFLSKVTVFSGYNLRLKNLKNYYLDGQSIFFLALPLFS